MSKLKLKKASETTNTPNTKEKPKLKSKTPTEAKEFVSTKKYKNLKEVMNTQRPFSMLFSGVEDENNFRILYDMGIRNFLISYHYVQKKHLNTSQYEEMGIKFFVDSGAFTYMSSLEHEEWSLDQWEEHIKKYLRWVEKHKDIIFAFASLDIEYLVGGDKVQEWNEKYFEPFMLRTGIPVCFVYHDNATKLTWEQYCQRYPYVGISWGGVDTQGNDVKYGVNRLKVAEKYGSLVHGMAMTQTSLLTKLPFYTVDSTTWLVGLQYGEVNFWTGTKMTRLKKDKWKGAMLEQIVAKGFDAQRLLDEDKEELVRVNVQAFIEAEVYVQDKLKSRMYWLRPDSVERKEEDLKNINFPSVEWIESNEKENWEEYAKTLNISTEDKNTAIDCIVDLTCFMNWYEDPYQSFIQDVYKPDLIKELHDLWINRIVGSEEERVQDLIEFYSDVLMGKNDKLLVLGTNFDRIVKERDTYVTDEEYEIVDVSEMELNNKLSKFLPPPKEDQAPEISELDDEIFRECGIEPVRDKNGRFLKGQKQVLKPKKMYSAKYPKMACDTCFVAQKCPEYKAGCVCAYSKMFERFDTRDMGDIIQAMQGIVDFSLGRLQRGMMFEMMEGGLPDSNVTGMMDQSMRYLAQLKSLYDNGNSEVLRQTKVVRADGSEETTTQVTNPSSSGILAQIFGSMGKETPDEKEEIDNLNIVDEPEK